MYIISGEIMPLHHSPLDLRPIVPLIYLRVHDELPRDDIIDIECPEIAVHGDQTVIFEVLHLAARKGIHGQQLPGERFMILGLNGFQEKVLGQGRQKVQVIFFRTLFGIGVVGFQGVVLVVEIRTVEKVVLNMQKVNVKILQVENVQDVFAF